jgi:RND family efflux transporter MFP subunit
MSAAKVIAAGLVVALVVGGVALFRVPVLSNTVKSLFASTSTDVILYKVLKGPLPITVIERGNLESSKNEDVYCNVEGQTTIIFIVPEGTRVTKGTRVCELDSASLRDQLVNQRITTKSAEANFQNAKLTREVAEIAVIEYEEGIYKQDFATVEGEIKLAESDLARAEDRLDWAQRMFDKGYVSMAQKVSEELSLKKAQFAKEQAESKRHVLVNYTKGKTIKELRSEVEKAHSDELAKQATFELERGKEQKLEKQIAACTLVAPIDGLVVYANDPMRNWGSNQPQIEEGATVRERQKIISIPDISRMQVNTKVHESQIDKITPNMKARIRIDAFAEQQLTGTVMEIAPLPDPGNFFSSDIKVYTTKVRIDDPLPGLRPGMTAQVEILVDRREDVLSVPVQAILPYSNKDHITKKEGEGYKQVEVELDANNEKFVQVKKGLSEGDVIVLNPLALMTEDQKREAFRTASNDTKKDWGEGGAAAGKGAAPGAGPAAKGAGPAAKGKDGDPAKAKGKTSKKGGRGGGFGNPAFAKKFQSIPPEDRARMKTASPEERMEILKKAGFTDEELQQMRNFGGGGGGGGGGFGGGRGRPGGGPPGGGPGGSDQ